MSDPRFEQLSIHANGVAFGALACGPASGPLALCLHGFPDAAPTWRLLLPVLADAGYRAVAPWMRGFAPTGPAPDGRYQTGALAADAVALHAALGGDERAVLIGHDWGAGATYGAAALEPGRWRRIVAMAVPVWPAMTAGLFTYDQLRRSWYMFFFQNPLAEMVVAADDLAFIDRLWADWSPGYEGDIAAVKEALRDPACLAAALGYYRATLGTAPHDPALAAEQAACTNIPRQPTLYLHGVDDGCIGLEVAEPSSSMLSPGSAFAAVEGAGHFLHLERPDEVNGRIRDWITG
jgi:pimeloyl-ACP methyl ester carboxylesterase